MQARAAVLTEFGVPLTLSEIEVAAPRAGEVMVAIAASGICGSDLRSAPACWWSAAAASV